MLILYNLRARVCVGTFSKVLCVAHDTNRRNHCFWMVLYKHVCTCHGAAVVEFTIGVDAVAIEPRALGSVDDQ